MSDIPVECYPGKNWGNGKYQMHAHYVCALCNDIEVNRIGGKKTVGGGDLE